MDVELLQMLSFSGVVHSCRLFISFYVTVNKSSSIPVRLSDTTNIRQKLYIVWKSWNMFNPGASRHFLSPVICKRYTDPQHTGRRHVMSAWWHAECQMKTCIKSVQAVTMTWRPPPSACTTHTCSKHTPFSSQSSIRRRLLNFEMMSQHLSWFPKPQWSYRSFYLEFII